MEHEEQPRITLNDLARMIANGFTEMRDQFGEVHQRIDGVEKRLDQKIERVQANLDQHRQESKDGFAGIHRVIGGMSHTLTDHEERLKELEGE